MCKELPDRFIFLVGLKNEKIDIYVRGGEIEPFLVKTGQGNLIHFA